MSEITIGLTNEKSVAVTIENTALAMGSGTLRVFATPAMIALVEGCCAESVEDLLGEGLTSVGTNVNIDSSAEESTRASLSTPKSFSIKPTQNYNDPLWRERLPFGGRFSVPKIKIALVSGYSGDT